MNKISAGGHLLSLKLNLIAISNWFKGPFFYHLITMHRNIEEICGEPHFSGLLSRLRGNQSSLWLHFHTCLLKMGFPGFFQHFSLKDLILYFFIESESEHYLASSVLSLTALSLTNSCCWDFKWCDFDWQCYLWCCHWCCWRWRYSRRQILTSYY